MTSAYTSKSSYDLNALLVIANILICGVTIYLYFTTDDTNYVNLSTVLMSCLLSIENIWMLLYEKKKKNSFILILVLVVTVFYIVRIPTLILIPSSAISFQESSVTVIDLNYTLTFILFANASMFLGFYIGTKHNARHINLSFSNDPIPKIKNSIIILSLLILINFFGFLNSEIFGRLNGFISEVFFNQHIILLFTLVMLVYHYDNISQQLRILFISIFLCIVILTSLSGSRSAFLTVFMLLLFSVLAVKQKFMVSKKILLLFLIVIPITFIMFITATFKRQNNIEDKITTEHIYMAINEELFDWSLMENHLGLIFFRIGFLDYSTEIIANRQNYSVILNREYYIKSLIDNVLTPGFDVFGTPRVSYAVSYVMTGRYIPSKYQIGESYQSNQLGIYGECYGLFYGFPALAVLCFLAFMFQKAYVAFKTTNDLLSCIYKAVIFKLFYVFLNSFGMDWFVMDIISAVLTTFLFARYYVSGGKKRIVLIPINN